MMTAIHPENRRRKKYTLLLAIGVLLILAYFLIPLPEPLFKPDYSTVVLDENGGILRVFLNQEEQWCFPPSDSLSEKLKQAVIYFEDRHFYHHPGVNPLAIVRALEQNLSSGEVVSGASTITMQVARLMKPKKRTYPNKWLEILQALKLEIKYSKDEILNIYLNHAPYGGNIIGYQAASYRYFGKPATALTWSEAAMLAVLPNAPGLISPTVNRKLLREKRDRLLKTLLEERVISEETYQLSLLEPLPVGSIPFRMAAPHAAQFLKDKYSDKSFVIRSTLNKSIQEQTEELLARQVQYLSRQGIRNGAALVVDTRTGEVKAYVGSQDFFDKAARGQVDGVQAVRSSGSLLKPFLYALCMDEGILLPQTVIKDIPSYYGSYSPANASLEYDGLVTAKQALIRSLNVPAIRLLYTHGQYQFYLFLKSAGLRSLFRSAEDYGLPLILGGAEVSPWDMAMMFRALARGGTFHPIRLTKEMAEPEQSTRENDLISPGACYLTLNILKELKRPGAEYYWEQFRNQWPLAWKTGTSYGHRDAWAVGVSPQWTIAVWVGNFDGEGTPNLSGAACAGPLLFDIFNSLPKDPELSWFKRPERDLRKVKLCAETGYLAGQYCRDVIVSEKPRFSRVLKICPYHQPRFVTNDGTQRVCSLCWEPGNHKQVSALIYSPDVVQYLRERGQILQEIPPHKSGCPSQKDWLAVQITYPQQNARIWLPRELDGSYQKITLHAAHRERHHTLYWYLDDRFSGTTREKHVMPVSLPAGWHHLVVLDETGNGDRKRFYVGRRE